MGSWQVALADVVPVRLPLTIDLAQLRAMVVEQAYPLAGEQAMVVDYADGCDQIVLSHPSVEVEGEQIRFLTKVNIHWGTPLFESCVAPVSWQGYVELFQVPRLNQNWQLSFEIRDSHLLNSSKQPVQVFDVVWNLVKEHVHTYLQQIQINLAPPVNRMQNSLLPMFDRQHQTTAHAFLQSLQPDGSKVVGDGVKIYIRGEIEAPYEGPYAPEPEVSEEEYARFLELWQVWDAYLIYQLKLFTDIPLSDDERHILLDTMLTTRYAFSEALEQKTVTDAFVRGQFLWGWKQLSPLFRRHLLQQSKRDVVGYLAFFTAHDALVALDKLGPSIGIEISADGFRRMAALISTQPLQFSPDGAADPSLRTIFGLDPLEEQPLEYDKPVQISPAEENAPTSWLEPQALWQAFWGTGTALAASGKKQSMDDIRNWTAEFTSAEQLLPRVTQVLRGAAQYKGKKVQVPGGSEWLEKMVMATAWQESCFRQYHVKNNTITYLLSYNSTSVGLMQVNEKIWKGIYNTQQLRWNAEYNAKAGSEILTLYLRDYLLKEKAPVKLESKKGQTFLAGWLYALYNGGPSQRKAYLKRQKTGKLYRSDKLFSEKYNRVSAGDWQTKVKCLL
ncbi:transglycosylase SLT domain-containing protein [Desulfogranum japonicum]|uniref:transglycosylase SLT domain-containing protein n=1 Tax=Desulfogranum japonicum TaxID=231447 RepID=UPI00040E6D2C|nr:transglycosylase SLT domain-containing protein [Desulfogranum japonicum]